MICCHRLDEDKHYKTLFGAYCKVHDEPNPTNSMVPRTRPVIGIGPRGNLQGSYKFLCPMWGKRSIWQAWTELTMLQRIIKKWIKWGKKKRCP